MDKEKLTFHRTIALLTRQQIDFMDKLAKDALFSCGIKLTYTKLISFLIDTVMHLNIDGKDIKTAKDLEEKIKNAVFSHIHLKALSDKEKAKISEKQITCAAKVFAAPSKN